MWSAGDENPSQVHRQGQQRRGYLVEEVQPLDVGLFRVEQLPGDVQELLRL